MEIGSIVGGSVSTPYSLPWQVGLVRPGEDRTGCGGTLIGPNHVLTAAHCMGSAFEVIVGEHNITAKEDGTRHKICEATSHPQYNAYTTNYDFAIVRLSEPVEIGVRAMPACLPDANDKKMTGDALAGKTVTVSGWGQPKSGWNVSQHNVLHVVDVPAISNKKCNESEYRNSIYRITDAMLCAGHAEGGIDSCQGDSGGRLKQYLIFVYHIRNIRHYFPSG